MKLSRTLLTYTVYFTLSKEAVNYFLEDGRSISKTIQTIGYPNRYTLSLWLKEDVEGYHSRPIAYSSNVVYNDIEKKKQLYILLFVKKLRNK